MRSRWPKAMVRSPMHSMIIASSRPLRASSTAGSRRSAENPAPVPMRKTSLIRLSPGVLVAAEVRRLGEEHLLDRLRRLLDGADLGHELGGLEHLLGLQRVAVVLVL